MSVEIPAASAHYVSAHLEQAPSFEERWAAWQARGAPHDRAVRLRMTIAAPILVVIASALYALMRRMHSFTRVCREGSTPWCSVRLA
jgi:hypothetical protein